jgi:hypothetical protein
MKREMMEMAALRPFARVQRALLGTLCVPALSACRSARHDSSQRDEFHLLSTF